MAFARPPDGSLFGADYRIVRALREGGMGSVLVAEQLSTGALRALKLMHPQFVQDEGMRRRFEQEARASARIESDYVVQVVGAGVDAATGMPWLAMELLEGEDLGEHVARVGKLSPGSARDVFRMLCHAVGAAHDAGLVHRDLKPENVFLARSKRPGEAFTLKVLDFGIARAAADVRATGTAALGTPLWMAPEQTSRGPRIGPPTDVWALGLIAFYLLTGHWYWRTAHLDSPSVTEFLRELTLDPLDPASLRAADLGLGGLPAGFDEWFARCVVREPAARFADAREAFRALEPVLAGASSDGDLARAGTLQVATAIAPGATPAATGPRPARPFFVGTETERALAAGAPPPRVPAFAPVVTAPATSVTGPAPTTTATVASRSGTRTWAAVVVLAVLVGGGGAWWWRDLRATTLASPAVAVTATVTSSPPPSPSTTHPAVSPEVAKTIANAVARESPMVTFAGTVYPLGYDAGAIDERPVHDVSFPTFMIAVDEVTVAKYARCIDAGKCTPAGTGDHCNTGASGRELHPVNCVSNAQAAAYCAWLGRRLPTEDEWEYAASGKAKRLYGWGNTAPAGRVCFGRPDAGTCEEGSFDGGATPEGMRDVTGNVWEWTSSDYCFYDPSVPCARDQKVARGGGWFSSDPNVIRTQVRQGYPPAIESANVGFRCARSL